MSAAAHLAGLDVPVQVARDFILANLENPHLLFSTAQEYRITTAMLAEMVGGTVTQAQVQAYFSSQGLDPLLLNAGSTPAPVSQAGVEMVPGITLQAARDYIFSNINDPGTIFSAAKSAGLTISMLTGIVGGSVTQAQVRGFFADHGFNADLLDGQPSPGASLGTPAQLLSASLAPLAGLVTLNSHPGALSMATVRDIVLAATGSASYLAAFNPANYGDVADGVLTGAELGLPGLASLAATVETLESLFYGTLVSSLKAIDLREALALGSFTSDHLTAMAAGDPAVLTQYHALIVSICADPASSPLLSDAQISGLVTVAATAFVELAGQAGAVSMFDGFFAGLLG